MTPRWISTEHSISIGGIVGAFLLVALPVNPASAQSWCGNPRNCTEAVICETPQLGRLDEEMSDLYFELRDQSSRRGARVLLDNQRDWLAARDTCGCNANCLVGYYRRRISQFRSILD